MVLQQNDFIHQVVELFPFDVTALL